ncbi:hypothetical protein KUL49_37180 [Alteromonas sp. KUL49]|nr:hypothetical protein KUL49_37180 [Alteromonas sp. KUL49]
MTYYKGNTHKKSHKKLTLFLPFKRENDDLAPFYKTAHKNIRLIFKLGDFLRDMLFDECMLGM